MVRKNSAGDEFAHVTRRRSGVRVKKFGSSAIPDNQSRKQCSNYRNLPRFNAWFIPFHKRKYKFQSKGRNESVDDV
jgi:hypothetical protein